MTEYDVNYTEKNKSPIIIQDGSKDKSTDVELFGREFLEYGQQLNEDLLHLLENFAAPEADGSTLFDASPDTTVTYDDILTQPTRGQLWYNTSRQKFYYWNETKWFPITNRGDYAANWGIISDGMSLPKPVSATTGYVFDYEECIWSVSPAAIPGKYDYLTCATDDSALVTMKYRFVGSPDLQSGLVNYLIIGIRGNVNHGTNVSPPLPITPTPTPTPTTTLTPTVTLTPSHTPTPPPTSGVTLSATPTPTTTRTPTPTPTTTPTNTPPNTPPATSAGPAPTPTSTPPNTPPVTPSNTPTPVAPLVALFKNKYNTGQTLTELYSYCNTAYHQAAGDVGIDCYGNVQYCNAGACAPEPGDTALGPELQITVSGGTAPYTVKFTNWTGNFNGWSSGCVVLVGNFGQLVVPYNSSGPVSSSISTTAVISSDGGQLTDILVTSACRVIPMDGSGTFDVIITDSANRTTTRTIAWGLSWENNN